MAEAAKKIDIGWFIAAENSAAADAAIRELASADGDPETLSLDEIAGIEADAKSPHAPIFQLIRADRLFADIRSYLAVKRIKALAGNAEAGESGSDWIHFHLTEEAPWRNIGDLLSVIAFLNPEADPASLMDEAVVIARHGEFFKANVDPMLGRMTDEELVGLLEAGADFKGPRAQDAIDAIIAKLKARGFRSKRAGRAVLAIAIASKEIDLAARARKKLKEGKETAEEIIGLLDIKTLFRIFTKSENQLSEPPEQTWGAKLITDISAVGKLPDKKIADGLISILHDEDQDTYTRAMAANSLGKLAEQGSRARGRIAIALMEFARDVGTRTGDKEISSRVLAKIYALVSLGKVGLTKVRDGDEERNVLDFLGYNLYHTTHPRLRLAAVIAFRFIAERGRPTGAELKKIGASLRDALADPDPNVRRVAYQSYKKFVKRSAEKK